MDDGGAQGDSPALPCRAAGTLLWWERGSSPQAQLSPPTQLQKYLQAGRFIVNLNGAVYTAPKQLASPPHSFPRYLRGSGGLCSSICSLATAMVCLLALASHRLSPGHLHRQHCRSRPLCW